MNVDFVLSTCINSTALHKDGLTAEERFFNTLTKELGIEPTLANVRSNENLLSLINLGVLTTGLNYCGTYVKPIFLKEKIYWHGTILEWRDDVALALKRKDIEEDQQIFYSAIYRFIRDKVYKHAFYRFKFSTNSNNTYRID